MTKQKVFNDAVTYIRSGVAIPAIVLKSSMVDGIESLNLLYADPDNGERQIMQGTSLRVGQVAHHIRPSVDGAAFGWLPLAVAEEDQELKQVEARADQLDAISDLLDDTPHRVPVAGDRDWSPEYEKVAVLKKDYDLAMEQIGKLKSPSPNEPELTNVGATTYQLVDLTPDQQKAVDQADQALGSIEDKEKNAVV